ncbi:siroheme synthase CysG [Paludibacterium purpuratum]|uniref:Siroheme synthase n=1 Tax=Paludibacterium purpuratum TaxID=1144873 RepID=A0A4V6PZ99_9NEIS|nr:siroheme synthase CysG [Paludibacterium purpuratum]TDR80759.1 uroporphyrinogen-III C-methyltransferase /precorrin-2 dehydrogenase [Paludibacterium purpuratum]
MDYFPIFLKLRDRPCLLVGGGETALRKARLLLDAGAVLTVVAPDLGPGLAELAARGQLRHLAETFASRHVEHMRLVVAASGQPALDRLVAEAAEAADIWVNVVDDPQTSSYITPSIIDRSPLVIALSTGGGAPVLARMLRERLESLIPAGWGRVADFARLMRQRVSARIANSDARRAFWESVLAGPIAEDLVAGNLERAEAQLTERLANADDVPRGAVYLVGAGPGNPDLLTFRALHLMQQADVVLYDNLVADVMVNWVRRDAERIYVGKTRANHTLSQEEINLLMVRLARDGKRVVRLKGGDPFIFGRGGEEIATLAQHGIPFEVVPGVTAASGAAAYAGIPLTHRDYAQSVTFVTGHRQDGSIDLDWPMLCRPRQTVVVYMGVATAPALCEAFIRHGRAADCPVAVVERATTVDQRVLVSTLADLPDKLAAVQIRSPSLIIVGEVVQLAAQLGWFDPRAGGDPATIGGSSRGTF